MFSFCLTYCVCGLFSAGQKAHSFSYLWGLPPIGRVRLVHFEQYSLGELVSVFWWIELNLASLKVSAVSSNVFWVVFALGIALGSLSANGQGCVPHTTWVRNWWWKCDVYLRERRRIPWPLSLVLTMQPAECSCSTTFTRPLVKSTSALFWQITTYLSLCHQLDSYCFET